MPWMTPLHGDSPGAMDWAHVTHPGKQKIRPDEVIRSGLGIWLVMDRAKKLRIQGDSGVIIPCVEALDFSDLSPGKSPWLLSIRSSEVSFLKHTLHRAVPHNGLHGHPGFHPIPESSPSFSPQRKTEPELPTGMGLVHRGTGCAPSHGGCIYLFPEIFIH